MAQFIYSLFYFRIYNNTTALNKFLNHFKQLVLSKKKTMYDIT